MKHFKILSLLGILLFSQYTIAQVTISGTVSNSPDPDVSFNLPVDGKFFAGNNKTVKISDKNTYLLKIDLKNPGFISVTNDFKIAHIYAEPGKSYQVNFDEKEINYADKTARKQIFLNDLGLYLDARSEVDVNARTNIKEKKIFYDNLLKEKKEQLDIALQQQLITKNEYDLFLNLIELKIQDYKSADYFFTYRLLFEQNDEKRADFNKEYVSAWENIYESAFKNKAFAQYLSPTEFTERLKGFRDIKETNFLNFDTKGMPYGIYQIQYFKALLPKDLIEFDWANRIYEGIQANNFEKEWIENYAEFKKAYPKSKLIPLLKPYIAKVEDFHADKKGDVVFVDNYENINSFKELFSQLKGKITYIDMWATWCGPCRQELQYSKKNHKILEEMGVLPLYLSVDLDVQDGVWKKMIKKLGLEGLHMRSNNVFKAEIDKILNQGIPYYIIVGKDGEVKVWGAKRPSDQKLLFEQLQQYL